MPQHPPPSHRLWWAGRNVAVGPDGYPLRVDRRRVGLEVAELLLLLGVQPPFTTSLFWRLVEAAVLVRHMNGLTAYQLQHGKHQGYCASSITLRSSFADESEQVAIIQESTLFAW